MKPLLFILICCSLPFSRMTAQQVALPAGSNTANAPVKSDSLHRPAHSPRTAGIMSAILPGSGQAYNHKYWKIPIVYAALGTGTYFIVSNIGYYDSIYLALKNRTAGLPDRYSGIYTTDDLFILKDYYRRNIDLSILATAALYGLNVVDAVVDAHLYYFDVSDKLSLHWNLQWQRNIPAISLSLHFK